MNPLYIAASYHSGYGFGGGSWMAHTVVGSILRGLIYRSIWSLTHGMSTAEIMTPAVVAIVVVALACRNSNK
jgi:hypothetical protein